MSHILSIIIPNYNHANYLEERIQSILNQSFQDFELIILDDFSIDKSHVIIEKYRSNPKVSHIVYNEQNSGSTFHQWIKGISLAVGKYIWIAESDDIASLEFLQNIIPIMEGNEKIGISFCNSQIIDEQGAFCQHNGESQTPKEIDKSFEAPFINNGLYAISMYMQPNNSIANASAVIFRKALFKNEYVRTDMKICGDWYFYICMLKDTDLYYTPLTLNYYRTHPNNVRSKIQDPNQIIKEYILVLNLILSLNVLSKTTKNKLADNLIFRYHLFNKKNQLKINTKLKVIQTIALLGRKNLYQFIKSLIKN